MLRWQQEWGTSIEVWERKIARGQRAPDKFYERPDFLPASVFYWQAFCDLGTERQFGMGVGPIPRSKAREYAEEIGIWDDDDFLSFWSILHAVDSEHLKLVNAPKKDAKKPKEPKNAKAKPNK